MHVLGNLVKIKIEYDGLSMDSANRKQSNKICYIALKTRMIIYDFRETFVFLDVNITLLPFTSAFRREVFFGHDG